jgi:adenine-specific DNA-methyltransferase
MKGYVETPADIVALMVNKLFKRKRPSRNSRILDPGCGTGAFIDGVIRWCHEHKVALPRIVGIELDPRHVHKAISRFRAHSSISIQCRDFLIPDEAKYDYVIGNPPYVPITELTEQEKSNYRALYETATGRFDLYLLFFERALQSLKAGGRLVFVTPEKFLYVETAKTLRQLLSARQVKEIQMLSEDVFGQLVTYPTITTVDNKPSSSKTFLMLRDGRRTRVEFPTDGSSWLPYVNTKQSTQDKYKLEDICVRISCGVATGADSIFVKDTEELDSELRRFAYPTLAGRELTATTDRLVSKHSMLVPYSRNGKLIQLDDLGALRDYLSRQEVRDRLEKRTCVSHKPWYAFHENLPLPDILRPKILCKDITTLPHFWIDLDGIIVPRHSLYYIVPRDSSRIEEIASYLNSETAKRWLESHCQHAANGYIRIQSHVLKKLPISVHLVEKPLVTVTT